MTQYRLTSPGQRDLDEIWVYIGEDNETAADRVIDALHEKFSLLARHPHLGRSCSDLMPGLHRIAVGSYVVFYRIRSEHVEIVRVIHGARDIEAVFHPEEES